MKQVKKVIKVSSTTAVPQLSSSIYLSLIAGEDVEVRSMGLPATGQMYKALAATRGTLAAKGKDLYIRPSFDDVEEDGIIKTVMVAHVVLM